jgi:hypothetical protein
MSKQTAGIIRIGGKVIPLEVYSNGFLHAKNTADEPLIRRAATETVWHVGSVSVPIDHEVAEHLKVIAQSMLEWQSLYSLVEGPFCSRPNDIERSTC